MPILFDPHGEKSSGLADLRLANDHVLQPGVEEDVLRLDVDGRLAHAAVAQAPVGVDQAPERGTWKWI